MALSDIFTVPFLVSLGITLLLAGLLGMFFVQRLQEQKQESLAAKDKLANEIRQVNASKQELEEQNQQLTAANQIH